MKQKSAIIICISVLIMLSFIAFWGNDNAFDKFKNNRRQFSLDEITKPKSAFIEKVDHEWKLELGAFGYDLDFDSTNNVYLVGSFNSDTFIAKYDKDGNQIWNRTWGGGSYESGRGIKVDSLGNIIITGNTESFGAGNRDAFLVKYDKDGNQKWNLTWGGVDDDTSWGIAVDSDNNITIIGDTENFGAQNDDCFIAKFNSTGYQLWNATWGSSGNDRPIKVAIDSNDNISIAQSLQGTYSILKFNTTGSQIFYKEWNKGIIRDMDIDRSDNIYLTLEIQEDGKTNNSNLIKLKSDFTLLWNYSWIDYDTGDLYMEPYAVGTDYNDNVYVGGKRYSLMKLNKSGEHCWNFTKSESSEQFVTEEISIDGQNNIYILYDWGKYLIKYDNSSHSVRFLKNAKFPEKKIYVIMVGIANYPGNENDLSYPTRDVEDMLEHLKSEYNIQTENIWILVNDYATKSNILATIDLIRSKINPEDDFFFFYSGHGGQESGNSYIYPYDSIPSNPSARISTSDFNSELDTINGLNKYVIIDACNSGRFATSSYRINRYIMASCRGTEDSLETWDLYNGVFTYFFIDSHLNSTVDLDSDGLISLEEQYPYILHKTLSYSSNYGVSQHPEASDSIAGKTILYPAADIIYYNNIKSTFNFDVKVYGSGQLYDVHLELFYDGGSILLDLKDFAVSETGFGDYIGQVSIDPTKNFKDSRLTLDVKGYQYLTLTYYHSLVDYDDEEDEEDEEDDVWGTKQTRIFKYGLSLVITSLSAIGIISLIYVINKKKKLRFK